MRILALETTSRYGSVALLEDGRVVSVDQLPADQRTAQTLAPQIHRQLDEADWRPTDIDLIAVARGPGSFTGLRIGVTTAKTLAYALSAEAIGVDTLAGQAGQAPSPRRPVWSVLDAQRGELFAALFGPDDNNGLPEQLESTRLIDSTIWLEQLQPGDVVTGSGLQRLAGRLPQGVEAIDESLWSLSAETVGLLGWRMYQAGQRDDFWKLSPLYYRPSYAEEKLTAPPTPRQQP